MRVFIPFIHVPSFVDWDKRFVRASYGFDVLIQCSLKCVFLNLMFCVISTNSLSELSMSLICGGHILDLKPNFCCVPLLLSPFTKKCAFHLIEWSPIKNWRDQGLTRKGLIRRLPTSISDTTELLAFLQLFTSKTRPTDRRLFVSSTCWFNSTLSLLI